MVNLRDDERLGTLSVWSHPVGLYRDPRSPFWWYDFSLHSRRYRFSTMMVNRRRAFEVAEEMKKAIILKAISPGAPERATFAGLAERYLEAVAREQVGRYGRGLETFVDYWRDRFGDALVMELRRPAIEGGRDILLQAGRSPATVNRYLACLRAMFNKAIAWELADRNPAAGPGLFLREPPPRERILHDDEIRRLMAAATLPLRDLVVLGLCTGARLGELVSARWTENVDLRDRMLRLEAAATKARRARLVPLNQTAVETLMRHPSRKDGERVFAWSMNHASRMFVRLAHDIELHGVTFHALRHTVVSRLHAAGVPVGTVALLVGHVVGRITISHYTHVQVDELREAVCHLEMPFAVGRVDVRQTPDAV